MQLNYFSYNNKPFSVVRFVCVEKAEQIRSLEITPKICVRHRSTDHSAVAYLLSCFSKAYVIY